MMIIMFGRDLGSDWRTGVWKLMQFVTVLRMSAVAVHYTPPKMFVKYIERQFVVIYATHVLSVFLFSQIFFLLLVYVSACFAVR